MRKPKSTTYRACFPKKRKAREFWLIGPGQDMWTTPPTVEEWKSLSKDGVQVIHVREVLARASKWAAHKPEKARKRR